MLWNLLSLLKYIGLIYFARMHVFTKYSINHLQRGRSIQGKIFSTEVTLETANLYATRGKETTLFLDDMEKRYDFHKAR